MNFFPSVRNDSSRMPAYVQRASSSMNGGALLNPQADVAVRRPPFGDNRTTMFSSWPLPAPPSDRAAMRQVISQLGKSTERHKATTSLSDAMKDYGTRQKIRSKLPPLATEKSRQVTNATQSVCVPHRSSPFDFLDRYVGAAIGRNTDTAATSVIDGNLSSSAALPLGPPMRASDRARMSAAAATTASNIKQ